MIKYLSKTRKITFGIFLFEVILVALVAVFWINNILDFRNITYISEIIFLGVVVLLAFDVFYFWLTLAKINKLRQSNDIEAANLIGGDIQSAYNLDQLGFLAIDNNDIVIWTNELFKQRGMDLLETNVYDFQPNLKELVGAPSSKKIKLVIKDRSYEVYFLAKPRFFVFKDITDYEGVVNYSREQRTVLGIIMIDNFDDVASDVDESADSVMKVRTEIMDYCRQYSVLLRRIKNDTYFTVCNYKSLNEMQKDSFSLLERVRKAVANDSTRLTISMGFAYDFPDIPKLNEMVNSALDLALSRGGDQVVVSQYGHEIIFYGGKSVAVENTSKIKVRSAADALCTVIKSSTNVLIMGHTMMDMDALGSALGVMAICDWCKKPSRIVWAPKRTEKKTRIAFQSAFPRDTLDRISCTPEAAVTQLKPSTLVIVVDVNVPKEVMAPKLLDTASKIVVIDHHRPGDSKIEGHVTSYIEPSASSASELVAEMIKFATANPRIELKPSFATIMLSGIFMDSNFFKSKSVGMRTFEAAEILKEFGADNSLANEYLKDEYEEYSLINKIVGTMQTYRPGIIFCHSNDDINVDRATLAKAANAVLSLKDIHCTFVVGRTANDQIAISARSDGSYSVQIIMEKLGGGGHLQMAATAFNGISVDEAVNKLVETLDNYIDEARVQIKTLEGE